MSDRPGGQVVVEALFALDVEQVFAVASVHNLPILEAVARHGGIAVGNVRHEQSAVHAADGYARATGRLGVALTSTGPGAANAMGGLFEARFASSPVLMITGQLESRFYGQGRGYLHEAERQADMLRTVTRETHTVRRIEDVGDAVVAAGRSARAGRPQPTAVEIPVDLQYARTDAPPPSAASVLPTAPRADRLDEAARIISAARRPVIWAGGGVVGADATDALRSLVNRPDWEHAKANTDDEGSSRTASPGVMAPWWRHRSSRG
ncbi:MAG TPA: thiamine pyrophosphate-binding protein [Nocardioidaceae bacterium]|nr:thiamine pyrophosphate-binding protein [Nocardioidaceae bacterium]